MSEKKIKLDEKLIRRILLNDEKETGVFMSLLAYSYIKICNISNKKYLKSMRKSLEIIEEEIKEKGEQ